MLAPEVVKGDYNSLPCAVGGDVEVRLEGVEHRVQRVRGERNLEPGVGDEGPHKKGQVRVGRQVSELDQEHVLRKHLAKAGAVEGQSGGGRGATPEGENLAKRGWAPRVST
jgi:hypothetical protein